MGHMLSASIPPANRKCHLNSLTSMCCGMLKHVFHRLHLSLVMLCNVSACRLSTALRVCLMGLQVTAASLNCGVSWHRQYFDQCCRFSTRRSLLCVQASFLPTSLEGDSTSWTTSWPAWMTTVPRYVSCLSCLCTTRCKGSSFLQPFECFSSVHACPPPPFHAGLP